MENNFVVIIGAMKSGTTSLFYYLSEHPEIAASKNKEPHFFSHNDPRNIDIKKYQSLWNWEPGNKIAMEASTTYTMQPKYPNIAEQIALIAKKEDACFRFIYIMRHPLVRIESHIRHLLAEKIIDVPKLIKEHINFSQYAMQIQSYIDAFDRKSIHLMLLEDLQDDPHLELRKICEFLSIDTSYQFQRVNVVRNSQETLNLHPLLRKIYKIPIVKKAGTKISPQLRQKLYKPLGRKNLHEVKLCEQEQTYILELLYSDLVKLNNEYGIDVKSKWQLPISY